MASKAYEDAANIVFSGLLKELPKGTVTHNAMLRVKEEGLKIEDAVKAALREMERLEDEYEEQGLEIPDIDVDDIYSRFEAVKEAGGLPEAEERTLFGDEQSYNEAQLELLSLREEAEMMMSSDDPDSLDEFEDSYTMLQDAISGITDEQANQVIEMLDEEETKIGAETKLENVLRKVELAGFNDQPIVISEFDELDALEADREYRAYVARKNIGPTTKEQGLSQREMNILGYGYGMDPDFDEDDAQPEGLILGGGTGPLDVPGGSAAGQAEWNAVRNDGKALAWLQANTEWQAPRKGVASKDALELALQRDLFISEVATMIKNPTWEGDLEGLYAAAWQKALARASNTVTNFVDVTDVWSSDYGDTGRTGGAAAVGGATASGLGGIFDEFRDFFTMEANPNYIFSNYGTFYQGMKDWDAEITSGIDLNSIRNELSMEKEMSDGSRQMQREDEVVVKAAELFAWLYSNTYRGRLDEFAVQGGYVAEERPEPEWSGKKETHGGTRMFSPAEMLYDDIMSILTSDEILLGNTDTLNSYVAKFMPAMVSNFQANTGEKWSVSYNNAKAGTGKYAKSGSAIGSSYLSNAVGSGYEEEEKFLEAFDEILPQFKGHFYDDWKDSIYTDASMAKYVMGEGETSLFDSTPDPLYAAPTPTDTEAFAYKDKWAADKQWFKDYIYNRNENQTALYDNAFELAGFLAQNADSVSLGAYDRLYAEVEGELDDVMGRRNAADKELALAYNLDLDNNEDDYRLLSWAKKFNPALYTPNSKGWNEAEGNMLNMIISATTPVGTPPTKRAWYRQAVSDSYRDFKRTGQNPNLFMQQMLEKGRIVSSRSKYYDDTMESGTRRKLTVAEKQRTQPY